MKIKSVGRWLLTDEGFEKGFIRIQGEELLEVCLGSPPRDSAKAVILPTFVNAHVHTGDSVAFPAPKGTVKELVAPPDGYKHRILASSSREDKIKAIRSSLGLMAATGTGDFVDFREEGLEGVRMLRESLSPESPRPLVMGRPTTANPSESGLNELLEGCDGIGMSAVSDWPMDMLESLSRKARSAGKMFALHVSESVREDIDEVLALRPDFVVHMTKAAAEDVRACSDRGVPIVVCPRSNEFYGSRPDIPMMLFSGAILALGTDNCMISQPDMFEEMRAAYRMCAQSKALGPSEIVKLATIGGRKVLKAKRNILTEYGEKGDLVAVRSGSGDPALELVTTAGPSMIDMVVRGGKIRRSKTCRK